MLADSRYSTGYEVTRNSGVTVPAIHGLPNIPTYAVVPAATRPKWQARWVAHVSAHNDNSLPNHDISCMHRNIWVLNDAHFFPLPAGSPAMSAPARRAASVAGAGGLLAPVARAAWHTNIRQPQGLAGVAGGWNALTPLEQARILADCAAYLPLGGLPLDPAVNAVALTTAPAYNTIFGCFFDRLPEFLCQLGDIFRASDFI